MTEFTVTRNGATHTFAIPDPLPIQLETYPFPKALKAKVDAGDAAWIAVSEAHDAWQDALDALEFHAPASDKQALTVAIRAGQPDPGTPATDAARRAEEVAWVGFEVAREDSSGPLTEAQQAVAEYLQSHAADVAKYELEQLAECHRAEREADDATARAVEARSRVGLTYVHMRWHSGDRFQPEPYRLNPDRDVRGARAFDSQVADKYQAMAEQAD
jgi:hypothetical protein